MPDLLLLVNSHAGKRGIRSKMMDIIDTFIKGGYTVSIYITQGTGDATRYVQRHGAAYDKIVCCGGDGTLSETVNGLASLEKPPVVGYISSGTTNDVGFSLNLPFDMEKAAEVAMNGIPKKWDIGRFCDKRYFCYVAAFGIFTEVTYATDQEAKNIWGRTAYILEGAKSIGAIESHHTIIECDGERHEGDYILVMVSNTVSVGGFRTVFDDEASDLSDGRFEITAVRQPKTPAEINHVIGMLLQLESAEEIKSDFFTFLHGKDIRISVDEAVAWTIDGEYGGTVAEASIEVLPGRLTIMSGDPEAVGDRRSLFSRIFKKRRQKNK